MFFFQQIVGYPSTKVLTSEEKDLVWQFRFYLTNQKKVNLQYFYCLTIIIFSFYKNRNLIDCNY